jgi:hypothetical protein
MGLSCRSTQVTRKKGTVMGGRQAVEAFAKLRGDWEAIRRRRRDEAPRHNLIRFLGYEFQEAAFHTPFLCDLLDPNGTHDQGSVFLQSFLDMLSRRAQQSGASWNYQWRELNAASWLVLPERGKIDISIRNHGENVLIFIENKICAAEQSNQITRYLERLRTEGRAYQHKLLIFLSPKRYGPPRTGEPHVHLTYDDDIANWLKSVDDKIADAAIGLRGNLRQYLQVITELNGNPTMPKQDILDLIVQPENLPWALEIEKAMWEAKTQLLRRFWRAVADVFQEWLREAKLADAFRIDGLGELESDPRKKDSGVCLVENAVAVDRPHVRLGVWYNNADGDICPGIAFSHRQPLHPHHLDEVRRLGEALPNNWKGDPSSNEWWLGYYDMGYRHNFGQFLEKIAQDSNGLARSMTEELFDLLKNHRDLVTAANTALQGAPPSLPTP